MEPETSSSITSKIAKVLEKYSANKVKLMVENALKRGLNLDNPIDSHKNSLLHLCVIYDLDDCMKKLLQSGADPQVYDIHGFSPLDIAVELGNQILCYQISRRIEYIDHVRNYYAQQNESFGAFLSNDTEVEDNYLPFIVGAIYEDYLDWTPSAKAQHLKELADSMQSYSKKLEQELQVLENRKINSENKLKDLHTYLVNREHEICNSILDRMEREKNFRVQLSAVSEEISHAKSLLTTIAHTTYWSGDVQIRRYKGIVYEHWKSVRLIVTGSLFSVIFDSHEEVPSSSSKKEISASENLEKRSKRDILIPMEDLTKVIIFKSCKSSSSLEKSITIQYKKKNKKDNKSTPTPSSCYGTPQPDSHNKRQRGDSILSEQDFSSLSQNFNTPRTDNDTTDTTNKNHSTSKQSSKNIHSLHIRVVHAKPTQSIITTSTPSVDTLAHIIKLLHERVEVVCDINGAVVEYEVGEKDIAIYQMLRQSSFSNKTEDSPMPQMVNRILQKMSIDLSERNTLTDNGSIELQLNEKTSYSPINQQSTVINSRVGQSMSISASSGSTSMESVSSIASAIQAKKNINSHNSFKKNELQLRFEDTMSSLQPQTASTTINDNTINTSQHHQTQYHPFVNPLEAVKESELDKESSSHFIDQLEEKQNETINNTTIEPLEERDFLHKEEIRRESKPVSRRFSAKLMSTELVKDVNYVPHVHMILLSCRDEREQLTNKLITSITSREKLLEELHYIHALRDIICHPPLIPTRVFALQNNFNIQFTPSSESGFNTPVRREKTPAVDRDQQSDLEKYINSLLENFQGGVVDIEIKPYFNFGAFSMSSYSSSMRPTSTKSSLRHQSTHSSVNYEHSKLMAHIDLETQYASAMHQKNLRTPATPAFEEVNRWSLYEDNTISRTSFVSEQNSSHNCHLLMSPRLLSSTTVTTTNPSISHRSSVLGLPPPPLRPQFEKLMEELATIWSCDITRFEIQEKIVEAGRIHEETLQKLIKMQIEEKSPSVTKEEELVEVQL